MDFYIIGSGGQAKEVWWLLKDIKKKEHVFKGFIDVKPKQTSIYIGDKKIDVIDEEVFFKKAATTRKKTGLAIAIGTPAIIKQVATKFSGMYFPNLIHPTARGHFDTLQIGQGNIIAAGCVLTVNVKLENFNTINSNSVVGHDTVIGNYNVFNPGCIISGCVNIGNGNLFGTNATVLQNLSVGNNSILGAAALLTKNLENNITAIGVPARPMKK